MSALPPGVHVWWWPKLGWGDPAKVAADLVELGVRGVIPQASLFAPVWCEQHAPALRAAGLHVTAGLGLDGAHTAPEIAGAIKHGLDSADGVMLDWEKPVLWETKSGNALAETIVDDVLTHRSDAIGRVIDCPWWAPLYYVDGAGNHHGTHPHAPTKTFGRLAASERFVQAYGAPNNGESARMLAWARDPSQYASMGAWAIRPAHQGYHRSVRDQVDTLMAEPTVCLWDYEEFDANCRTALRAVKALRALGFDGAGGVRAFQTSVGLTPDGIVGSRTLAALSIS